MMPHRLLDALAYSSLLAASIGFAASVVVSWVLDAPSPLHWSLLAGLGTFIIYGLDRLRDTDRDRETSPARTAFIEAHRTLLTSCIVASAIAFGGLVFSAPRAILVLCAGIGAVGLLHRRLKAAAMAKTLYVSIAWLASVVGMPWLAAGRPATGFVIAAILAPVLAANLIASNLRDEETQVLRAHPDRARWVACAATALGLTIAVLGPPESRALAWVAAAELAALLRFRRGERYGLVVVDGALLLGCVAAGVQLSVFPS